MIQGNQIMRVGQLVQAIRQLVEGVPGWQKVWVEAELSGVKRHTSGHWYFTLKDDQAQLRAVMFRRDAAGLAMPLKDGMQVQVLGRVGVFERDGQTQFYVNAVRDVGLGRAQEMLEQLTRQLAAEGVFSRTKRQVPRLPRAIGVITSETGAARRDIEAVVARRYPGMPVRLYPVVVQGESAPMALAAALLSVVASDVDVVIVGRGGGSKEDLSAFNDERVVRAVVQCSVPVISAVGHEIDTTLVDLAADLRAPTPSAAAELAVPERDRLVAWQTTLWQRSEAALRQRLQWETRRLSGWIEHGVLRRPDQLVRESRIQLDRLGERADRAWETETSSQRHRWERIQAALRGLNPKSTLERGYAYVTKESGELVTATDVNPDESYRVHWYNGSHRMRRTES